MTETLRWARRPRPSTPTQTRAKVRYYTAKRACNGCRRVLGDATGSEVMIAGRHVADLKLSGPGERPPKALGLDAKHDGWGLPDVRPECPVCTPNPDGLEWEFELPIHTPWAESNGRRGTQVAAIIQSKHRRRIKTFAHAEALRQRLPPLRAMEVEYHYAPQHSVGEGGGRDADNIAAPRKPFVDGLVKLDNVLPRDTWDLVRHPEPQLRDPTGRPGRIWLIVREVDPR